MEDTLVGRRCWLQVEDSDAWVLATVAEHYPTRQQVSLERDTAPLGVRRQLTLSEAAFSELAAVSGDDASPEISDLVALDDVQECTMIHALRQRYARNEIYRAQGYCFRTRRGIEAFGNAGCQYDNADEVPLSAAQRRTIADIQREERARRCPR